MAGRAFPVAALLLATLGLAGAAPQAAAETSSVRPEPNTRVPAGVTRYAPTVFPDRIVVSPAQDAATGGVLRRLRDAGGLQGRRVGPSGMAIHAAQPHRPRAIGGIQLGALHGEPGVAVGGVAEGRGRVLHGQGRSVESGIQQAVDDRRLRGGGAEKREESTDNPVAKNGGIHLVFLSGACRGTRRPVPGAKTHDPAEV